MHAARRRNGDRVVFVADDRRAGVEQHRLELKRRGCMALSKLCNLAFSSKSVEGVTGGRGRGRHLVSQFLKVK
jgi:hypothetical protein